MSIVTYPLNETLYTAEDAAMYNFAISSGVASGEDFACSVSGGDNIVTVSPGIGWIKNNRFGGFVVGSKSQQSVDVGLPDAVYPRIDIVALQFDVAKNGTSLIVKKGTPATNPSIPERVTTESVYELYLCSVYRNPSDTVLSNPSITDLRMHPGYCGLMANSITKIDTEAISRQVYSLIEDFRTAIADVEAGEGVMTQALWTQNDAIRVDKGGTGATTPSKALENLGLLDYIVASGIDGDWNWEMWKSGKAVCWGVASLGNVNVNKRWGLSEDGYPWRESAAFTEDFPEGLFIDAPQFLDITVVNSTAAVFVSRYVEDLTATNTGKFTLSRPTSMTVNNVKLGFYAIGRWKNSDGSGNNIETALGDIIALQEEYIGGEAE